MASIERPRRPASVIILAVFQLAVGVIGVGYEVLKAGSTLLLMNSPAVLKAAEAANPIVAAMAVTPNYFAIHTAASLVGLVLSIVLIADGIGLLLLRRWAYNLGVLYAWLSIAYQVAWCAYYFLVVMPLIMAMLENVPVPAVAGGPAAANPQQYREALKIGANVDAYMTPIGLIYPIFVLIMLLAVRNAFRRPKPAPEGVEERGFSAEAGIQEGPPTGVTDLPPGYEPDDRIGPAPR